MDPITTFWAQIGALATCVVALAGFIGYLIKSWMPAQAERAERRIDALTTRYEGRIDMLMAQGRQETAAALKELAAERREWAKVVGALASRVEENTMAIRENGEVVSEVHRIVLAVPPTHKPPAS